MDKIGFIYSMLDYRDFLRKMVKTAALGVQIKTFGELAAILGVQQAYLSRVLKGEVNLNADQLDSAIQIAGLNERESDFLLLLLERDRCQSQSRKRRLRERLEKFRDESRKSVNHIEARFVTSENTLKEQRYYLEPMAQVLHMALHIKKFQYSPALLCECLRLSPSKLSELMGILMASSLVAHSKTDNRYTPTESNIQLSPDSVLSGINHFLARTKALDHLQNAGDDSSYQFTAVVSADSETRGKIRDEFNSFLRKIKPLIGQAPSEEVLQINFDLIRWTT